MCHLFASVCHLSLDEKHHIPPLTGVQHTGALRHLRRPSDDHRKQSLGDATRGEILAASCNRAPTYQRSSTSAEAHNARFPVEVATPRHPGRPVDTRNATQNRSYIAELTGILA